MAEIPTDPSKPVYIICNTQNRSSALLRSLRNAGGYDHVQLVTGGPPPASPAPLPLLPDCAAPAPPPPLPAASPPLPAGPAGPPLAALAGDDVAVAPAGSAPPEGSRVASPSSPQPVSVESATNEARMGRRIEARISNPRALAKRGN